MAHTARADRSRFNFGRSFTLLKTSTCEADVSGAANGSFRVEAV
jgi:hypothetical protein